MTDDEYEHDDNLHELNLPPHEELWSAVREAHDYLQEYVNDISSHTHPVYGEVGFNSWVWGIAISDKECWVCLAGLRYLRKEDKLLRVPSVSDTDIFLDALRDPYTNREHIQRWLGAIAPYSWTSWSPLDKPEEILTFLDWLLEQRTHNALGANDNV
ncbi:hypothetical protein [Microcoleus phage My-WqHQDG]|nr:hypothetical protein [Microcoleus phage My-WqHQDG]